LIALPQSNVINQAPNKFIQLNESILDLKIGIFPLQDFIFVLGEKSISLIDFKIGGLGKKNWDKKLFFLKKKKKLQKLQK
jgi:hypothetical protein